MTQNTKGELMNHTIHIKKLGPINECTLEIKQFNPEHPLNELNRLNKLKKSNPEAFHYWYQIYKIIQENEESK